MSELPPKQRRTTPSQTTRSAAKEEPTPQRATTQRVSTQRSASQQPNNAQRASTTTRRTTTQQQQRRPVSGQRSSQASRYRQAPRRDPFPIIIGAIVGAGLLSVVLIVLLLGNNNSGGTVAGGAVATSTLAAGGGGVMTKPTGAAGVATTNTSSDLPGTPMPDEGNKHVTAGEAITYQNYPPSSGTHYDATAEYGFSAKEIPEGQIVHSMEHGAVVLYYKPDLPDATKEELRKAYDQLPPGKYGKVKMVIAPFSQMETPMTLAAWTRLLPMKEYNYQTVFTFYKALVDKGPEDVP